LLPVLLAALVSVSAPSVAQAQSPSPAASPSPSPSEIYRSARSLWRPQSRPPFVRYRIDFHFERQSRVIDRAYLVVVRTSDHRAYFEGIPVSPSDRPDKRQFLKDFSEPDVLDAIDSPLALVAPAASPAPEPSGMKSIGTIVATSHDYDVRTIGEETIDGRLVYHLGLQPVRAGKMYSLRELWVDEETDRTIRLKLQQRFVTTPVSIEFDFAAVPPDRWYQQRITASGPFLHILFFTYSANVAVRYSQFDFPSDVPDWNFDETLFKSHSHAAARTEDNRYGAALRAR
jgi:hypothetical protein